jgi:hypothetical protein
VLGSAELIAFVPTRDPARSRALRIADVSRVPGHRPAAFTVLGWHVPDVESTVTELRARGVTFERFAGMSQDSLGIWDSPSGARVAWFKDPDDNILSLTQS